MRQTERGTWIWKYDPRTRRPVMEMSLPEEERARRREERAHRLWAAAARISCPVLVVRGGESDLFLDEDAARTAAGFAHARVVTVDDARHNVHSDRPRELAAAIHDFLATEIAATGS